MGRLNLPWKTFGRGIMADGSVSAFDVYQARVMWDSRLRQVLVSELDATPLVGMALLRGFEIRMLVKARGKVTIERISKP
jgi:predicted aspartyl protease